jgi:hypothetical protein
MTGFQTTHKMSNKWELEKYKFVTYVFWKAMQDVPDEESRHLKKEMLKYTEAPDSEVTWQGVR